MKRPYLYAVVQLGALIWVAVTLMAAVQQQNSPAYAPGIQPPTATGSDAVLAVLITTCVSAVLSLVGIGAQMFRESRNRRWDQEDRRIARDEQGAKLDALKVQSASNRAEVVGKLDEHARAAEQAAFQVKIAADRLARMGAVLDTAPAMRRRATDIPLEATLPQSVVKMVEETRDTAKKIEPVIEETLSRVTALGEPHDG